MEIPKYDELMNPALSALHRLGGSASVGELEDEVAGILNLTDKQVNEIHRGNRTKLGYRLAWARNYLKRYGLIDNSVRGVWTLTAEGRDTERISKNKIKRFVKGQATKAGTKKVLKAKSVSDDPELSTRDDWRDELLTALKKMPSDAFERLSQRLLRESGFVQVEVTARSGDGGIDGKGVLRIGALLSFHVVFQCKRYKKSVSPSIVRDFRGAMDGRADKGLLITTGTFSREAKREASRDGAQPIDLVDGDAFVEKLKELGLGVDIKPVTVERITVNYDWIKSI